MSATDQLLKDTRFLDQLYDVDSMMMIKSPIASGFVTLLGGGGSDRHRKAIADSDLSLAFLSLTQGNVLDACFGVANASVVRREETPASKSARDAKNLLDECASSTSPTSFERIAISAYSDAFQLVIIHRDQMDRLNCFTRCFRAKKIRKKTERNLQEAFMGLAKAIAENPAAASH